MATSLAVAYGDGVGPEVMDAALHVMREAGAQLEIVTIEIGSRIYAMEANFGVLPSGLQALERVKIMLKGPTDAPANDMYDEVTVSLRKRFDLEDIHRIEHRYDLAPQIGAIGWVNERFALFEPSHGPMHDIAGQNIADPSSMILAGVMALSHLGQRDIADSIYQAWRRVMEEGSPAGTSEFAERVAGRLFAY